MNKNEFIHKRLQWSQCKTVAGCEVFLAVESRPGLGFTESMDDLLATYEIGLADLNLSQHTEIALRLHVSDVENQAEMIKRVLAQRTVFSFVSVYGQTPASLARITLQAWHLDAPSVKKQIVGTCGLAICHGRYRSLWLHGYPCGTGKSSYCQTQESFSQVASTLSEQGGTLLDNLLRTWIFVRDVDNNYQGLVSARRELFRTHGLTRETHYVASTGIEGRHADHNILVGFDALCIFGTRKEQILHLNALDHICPTYKYNVTFERGTKVCFGDREHLYLSGTASINSQGDVVHPGRVRKQTERTLENMRALLADGGAVLEDMKIMTVYVRDLADAAQVQHVLNQSPVAGVPRVFVQGSVCRPQWLVEIEGIAVKEKQNPGYDPYF